MSRLSWRKYVLTPNPVASALMAKMKIAPQDRPRVRLECLRLLATRTLNPARSRLIGGFIETYLQLSAEELKQYEREFAKLAPTDKEAAMELMTSWERKGLEEGIRKGKQEGAARLVARQIQRCFGSVSPDMAAQLKDLSAEQLDVLGESLFEFTSLEDLQAWFSQYHSAVISE